MFRPSSFNTRVCKQNQAKLNKILVCVVQPYGGSQSSEYEAASPAAAQCMYLSGLQAEQVQLNAEYASSKTSGRKKSLTRDRSSSLVIMTTVAPRCSHTMRQKSPNVSGNGPCNEAMLALLTEISKLLKTEMSQCQQKSLNISGNGPCSEAMLASLTEISKLLKTEMRQCWHCQQKSLNIWGNGPCSEATLALSTAISKLLKTEMR